MPLIRSTGLAAAAAAILFILACNGSGQVEQQPPQRIPSAQEAEQQEDDNGTPAMLDHVQAWSTLAAAVFAVSGLGGVIWTLRRGRRQQRVQSGPYVRVDVGPTTAATSDFEAPKNPHFVSSDDVVDLAPDLDDDQKVSLSAWLTNYQPHPLGTAFRVAAFFVIEVRPHASLVPVYQYSIVRVAYVEHKKPVKIELFRVPGNSTAVLWLSRLAFSDFYDEYYKHYEGKNENALHGRLTCTYANGNFTCIPEGRPAARWPIQRLA